MLFNDIMQRNHGRLQLFDKLKQLNTFSDVKRMWDKIQNSALLHCLHVNIHQIQIVQLQYSILAT